LATRLLGTLNPSTLPPTDLEKNLVFKYQWPAVPVSSFFAFEAELVLVCHRPGEWFIFIRNFPLYILLGSHSRKRAGKRFFRNNHRMIEYAGSSGA
jgi:hypothetical protein